MLDFPIGISCGNNMLCMEILCQVSPSNTGEWSLSILIVNSKFELSVGNIEHIYPTNGGAGSYVFVVLAELDRVVETVPITQNVSFSDVGIIMENVLSNKGQPGWKLTLIPLGRCHLRWHCF